MSASATRGRRRPSPERDQRMGSFAVQSLRDDHFAEGCLEIEGLFSVALNLAIPCAMGTGSWEALPRPGQATQASRRGPFTVNY